MSAKAMSNGTNAHMTLDKKHLIVAPHGCAIAKRTRLLKMPSEGTSSIMPLRTR